MRLPLCAKATMGLTRLSDEVEYTSGRGWRLGAESAGSSAAPSPQPLVPAELSVRRRLRWPDGALIRLRHRCETLVDKLLQTLTAVRLGRIDVALRVGRDAVHRVELPGLAAAVAEGGELGQRQAIEHVHLFVGAVRQVEVLLRGVLREGDVPHGAVAERRLLDEGFLL